MDMCCSGGGTDITRNTTITGDICVSQVGKNISQGIIMCFPDRGTHITRSMYFRGRGTYITRDMCFQGRGMHINRYMGFTSRETHITRDTQGICVSQVGEHISLAICVSQVGNTYH